MSVGSELERGADVDRLAVAAVVLKRRQPVALDIVADAAGHCDSTGQRIGAADVERNIVAAAKRVDRAASRAVGADREGNSYNVNADEAAGAVARA